MHPPATEKSQQQTYFSAGIIHDAHEFLSHPLYHSITDDQHSLHPRGASWLSVYVCVRQRDMRDSMFRCDNSVAAEFQILHLSV